MSILLSALLLAILVPGRGDDTEPSCRAQLKGTLLTTTIQFETGYALQAPWTVVQSRREWAGTEQSTMVVDLRLDRIDELDDLTGDRKTMKLPRAVQVTVEGATEPDVVMQAAQTWCSTVIKARGERAASRNLVPLRPGHIT